MKINQVAVQMYTCRQSTQTPADMAKALKKVKAIGYDAIQLSGEGEMDDHELRDMIESEGLVCCATHEPPNTILNDPQAVVDRLHNLNCKYTAYPWPVDIDFGCEESITMLIQKLNAAGKLLHEAGQVLAYHNHHMEFRRVNGKLGINRIYDETDPVYLQGEIDSYWVHYGGGDNLAWCKRLKNRLPLYHLKDYKINDENQIYYAEIGQGNLDYKTLVPAAEAAGCEWFIVEQDECDGDPFDSLKMSFDYVAENLCDLPVPAI